MAIEPDIFLVDLLRRSAAARSADRAEVTVLPAAVSDALGVEEFCIAARGRSASHLASSSGSVPSRGTRQIVWVITITLDWLLDHLPQPTVLKIDVEGAEDRVLAGAEKLVSQAKPLVLCEVSTEKAAACTRFFRRHGYSLYDLDQPTGGKIEAAAFNTLAVPDK